MKNANNRWFTVTVTLTDAGASKSRCDGISALGSDQALDGFGSLLAKKHAIQAAAPADYKTHDFKVRGDYVGRVMGEMAKTLRVGWEMISNIKIEEAL